MFCPPALGSLALSLSRSIVLAAFLALALSASCLSTDLTLPFPRPFTAFPLPFPRPFSGFPLHVAHSSSAPTGGGGLGRRWLARRAHGFPVSNLTAASCRFGRLCSASPISPISPRLLRELPLFPGCVHTSVTSRHLTSLSLAQRPCLNVQRRRHPTSCGRAVL